MSRYFFEARWKKVKPSIVGRKNSPRFGIKPDKVIWSIFGHNPEIIVEAACSPLLFSDIIPPSGALWVKPIFDPFESQFAGPFNVIRSPTNDPAFGAFTEHFSCKAISSNKGLERFLGCFGIAL